jgi:regulator of cell morphogenesis and NO signaling
VDRHHRFVREELAGIAIALADVCSSPGVRHELLAMSGTFGRLSEMILPHLHYEEENIFRAVEALEKSWHSSGPMRSSDADLVATLREVTSEHGAIDSQLRTMRELRALLQESAELPPRCSAILEALATLEAHLHEYMFLENCILFPRAAALVEQSVAPVAPFPGR